MAQHAKKKPIPKGVWIGSGIAAGVALLAVAVILLVNNGVFAAMAELWRGGAGDSSALVDSSTLPPADSSGADSSGDSSHPPEPDPVFRKPDKLSGVVLQPGTDYLTSAKDTAEKVKTQLDTALKGVADWGMNTLFLPMTTTDGTAVYPSAVLDGRELKNTDGTAFDPVAYLLEAAREKGMYVYGVLDLRLSDKDGWDPQQAEDAAAMKAFAAEAAARYALDGWLVEDYAYPINTKGDAAGMEQAITAAVTGVVQTLKAADRNLYVGLLSHAVWAHKRVDSRGSNTDGVYEEYTDGHANSLAWLDAELFDFVLVGNDRPTSHGTAGFQAVLDWWTGVCNQRNLPVYILHAADKAAAGEKNWGGDELARQYLACQQTAGWAGSAFSSLAALQKDTGGYATVLRKAMKGEIDSDYRFQELTFSSPTKTSVTTEESKFTFLGSTDPNFPVTMNGKAVELTERGGFSVEVTLSPGKNTFTFVSNGKTVTYTITYTVTVLKSVSPTAAQTMNGGDILVFTAIARKKATVTATFNGKTVTMKETPLKEEEGANDPEYSDFSNYTASFTLPAGIAGQAQSLGSATIKASYSGLSGSMKTGAVTVKALPKADAPEVELPGVIADLKPINPNTGGETLKTGDIVIIDRDYAETFNGSPVEDWSRPTNAYLPKGTTDVIVKTVSLGSTKYYLLGCGRRVYTKDAALYIENGKVTANTMKQTGVQISQTHTILTLDSTWRVPYNVQLLPQTYQNPDSGTSTQPNYSINKTGQTTEYVDVTFSYTTKVPAAAPDMTDSPLFSKAEWRKGGENETVLRLYLRQKGQFYGYSVVWDNDGTLHLSFKHPHGIAKNPAESPLKGVRIVIDPGHGGTSSGTYGTIPGLYEKTLTLTYSKLLQAKLESLGATVVMTRTTDVLPDKEDMSPRTDHARNNGTDLFVSIHMNGVSGESASGCSIHYFNEYSYPVNRLITDSMRAVEKQYNTGNRSEPCAWSPFFVTRLHDCPAVLVECGFMTNKHNMELLINTTYQDKLTQAMADGILSYFRALPTYTVQVTNPSTTTSTTTTTSAATTTTAAPPSSTATAAASASANAGSERKETTTLPVTD